MAAAAPIFAAISGAIGLAKTVSGLFSGSGNTPKVAQPSAATPVDTNTAARVAQDSQLKKNAALVQSGKSGQVLTNALGLKELDKFISKPTIMGA